MSAGNASGWVKFTDKYADLDTIRPKPDSRPTEVEQLAYDIAKADLESVILAIIALEEPVSGNEILEGTLESVTGLQLSPGTVYPQLHDLEQWGYIERTELPTGHLWTIADVELTERKLSRVADQLHALAKLLRIGAAASDGTGIDDETHLKLLVEHS